MKFFYLPIVFAFTFSTISCQIRNVEIGSGPFINDLFSHPLDMGDFFFSYGLQTTVRTYKQFKEYNLYYGIGLNNFNYFINGNALFTGSNSSLRWNSYYASFIMGKRFPILKKSSMHLQSNTKLLLHRKQGLTQRRLFTIFDLGGRFGIGKSFYFLFNLPIPVTSMFYSNTFQILGGANEKFPVRVENIGFHIGVGYKFKSK